MFYFRHAIFTLSPDTFVSFSLCVCAFLMMCGNMLYEKKNKKTMWHVFVWYMKMYTNNLSIDKRVDIRQTYLQGIASRSETLNCNLFLLRYFWHLDIPSASEASALCIFEIHLLHICVLQKRKCNCNAPVLCLCQQSMSRTYPAELKVRLSIGGYGKYKFSS